MTSSRIAFIPERLRPKSIGKFMSAAIMIPSMSMRGRPGQCGISSVAAQTLFSKRISSFALMGTQAASIHRGVLGFMAYSGGQRRLDRVPAKLLIPVFQRHLDWRQCSAFHSEASAPTASGTGDPQRSCGSAGALAGRTHAEQAQAPVEEAYDDEFVAREAVLSYLKSQDIETAELEAVALPPSVAVMTERIEFLRKIGLTNRDINDYPLMVGCSVKKNLIPVLSYLEKLNVEARYLPDLIRKYPMVLNSSVTMDLSPVVTFMLGVGIDRLNIGRVLTRFPDILGFKIEGTMSTSVAYLVSLGVGMREIGPMITDYPEILGMRVGNNIKLKADYLISLGIPKEVLAKVLEVKPFILGFDLEKKMKPAVNGLRDVGVRESFISRVIIQYADILGLDIKQRLDTKLGWLVKYAGVKREDIASIVEKLPQILAINIVLAQSRVTFLTKEGFTLQDVGAMVTKCPQILALSVDDVLKPSLQFFLTSMGRPLSELVNYPSYFTYNLENRIRPRHIQIEQKGIQCSLPWLLNCSDSKFTERLQVEFVEKADGEEDPDPLVITGGRVRVKGEDVTAEASDDETVAAES